MSQQGQRDIFKNLAQNIAQASCSCFFERAWENNPVHDNYAAGQIGGKPLHIQYEEGVSLGYCYFTSSSKKPLYRFGFGISYADFSFENLHLSASGIPANGTVTVSRLKNTGLCGGAEVAQLYVSDPSATIRRPFKELRGFKKVFL